MKFRLAVLVLAIVAAPAFADWRDTPMIDDTSAAACSVLKDHIARVEGLSEGKPDPTWYCDEMSDSPSDFLRVFQLRSKASPKTLPISQLIGTFAVARRSTVVLEVDVAELRLVPISKEYAPTK